MAAAVRMAVGEGDVCCSGGGVNGSGHQDGGGKGIHRVSLTQSQVLVTTGATNACNKSKFSS
jgi:hypothetical protein